MQQQRTPGLWKVQIKTFGKLTTGNTLSVFSVVIIQIIDFPRIDTLQIYFDAVHIGFRTAKSHNNT